MDPILQAKINKWVWKNYERSILQYLGVESLQKPSIDFSIESEWDEGYNYSEYTYADSRMCVYIRWDGGLDWSPGRMEMASNGEIDIRKILIEIFSM